jgi:hypothetical protein
MSNTFTTGKTFQTGEQVTANDLNNAVNQAVPLVPLTDDQSITIVNNKIAVKDGDSTNGVPLTKLKHIIGHSVIGNTGSNDSAPTNIEVAAYEAVLGNSAGNGLITDKIDTNNIKDDAITPAKTSFINHSTATMTLTGTAPIIILDDSGNAGESPELNGNSVEGSLSILATKSGADITIDADDNLMLKHNGTEGLRVSADAGKDQGGSSVAGAKVTGGLYVTGDVYVDDQVVADHLLLQGDDPTITFADDNSSGKQNPLITGNSTNGNLAILTKESESELILECSDNLLLKTTNDPTQDQSGTNDFVERFRASHNAGKDSSGSASAGCKVTGDLDISNDLHVTGETRITTITGNPIIKNSSPKITLQDTDNSGTDPYIIGDSAGSIGVYSTATGSDIILDTNDVVLLRHQGSNIFAVSDDVAKDAAGSNASGAQVTGCLEVTQEANIGKTKLGADSILASSPSTSDNSTKIATTAFVTTGVKNGATAVYKTSGSTNTDNTRYFSTGISQVVDPYNIVTQNGGNFTFHEAGTYLVELVGIFDDNDAQSQDRYTLSFVNNTSSILNLQDDLIVIGSTGTSTSQGHNFSMSIVRTVSNASTDKLAVYVGPISGADAALWDARDCVFKITQLS